MFSVLKQSVRVLATDYESFAIEYSCSDSALISRHGKLCIIMVFMISGAIAFIGTARKYLGAYKKAKAIEEDPKKGHEGP